MKALLFLKRAQIELEDSATWYEQQSEGLGSRFLDVVRNKLDLVLQNPELFPRKEYNYREAVLRTFPFSMIFKFEKKENLIIVISVFHNRRNPKLKFTRTKAK